MATFRAIPNFPGYSVSKNGKVKGPTGLLSPRKDSDGYMRVDIRKGKKRFTRFVHTLVAKAWNGESATEVDHKDGNRKNNSSGNLETVSHAENIKRIRR